MAKYYQMKTELVKTALTSELPLPWFAKQFVNDATPFDSFRIATKNYSGCTRIDSDKGVSLFDESLDIKALDLFIQTM